MTLPRAELAGASGWRRLVAWWRTRRAARTVRRRAQVDGALLRLRLEYERGGRAAARAEADRMLAERRVIGRLPPPPPTSIPGPGVPAPR